MMPDLGRYAFEVSMAYAVSLAVLVALVGWYLLRGARMRRQLAEVEARKGRRNA